MVASPSMKLSHRSLFGASALLALSVLASATLFAPAAAQAQVTGDGDVAMQIKGYWGGTTASDPAVIGTLTLADEHGKNPRSFGVLSAQGYDPVTMGMDVFQQASIKPAIIVFGRAKETAALFGAPDKKKVTIIGVYWSNNGDLIVGSVKFPDAAAAAPKAAK